MRKVLAVVVLAGLLGCGIGDEEDEGDVAGSEEALLGGLGVLRLHPGNGRYVTDSTGEAIYLTGSHTWYVIHSSHSVPSADEFEAYLDWLQSHGHNFTRLWTGWSAISHKLLPWNRTGPGTAVDGKPKFNMRSFNQTYFDTLFDRVMRVQRRQMYCSVMFFGSAIGFNTSTWTDLAWNPRNNINPELASAFSTTDGRTFFTSNPAALETERMLVRKLIDTLGVFDNLIWETANEPCHTSPENCVNVSSAVPWDKAMVAYAKSYESSKPKRHLVGLTGGGGFGKTMLSSAADWVSPDWSEYLQGGPATFAGKLVVSDTDHLSPYYRNDPSDVPAMRKWVWRSFARGVNPIYMDRYNSNAGVIDHAFDPVRQAMGATRTLATSEIHDLARMLPSSTVCSTSYCLVNPGKEYLVYQPTGGASFTVALPAGSYDYRWYDPVKRAMLGKYPVSGGATRSFAPPISTDSVLIIQARDLYPPEPASITVDNGAAGTSSTGTWRVSAGASPYGGSSLYARNGATYTWRAKLPHSGSYDVFMWWTQYPSRSTSVPVTVTHSAGSFTRHVNQQQNGGRWVLLGTFSFDASAGGTVKLSAPDPYPTSYCADAVRFVPR